MGKDYTEIDSQILQAINAFDGVPNSNNLGKHGGGTLPYSNSVIQSRFDSNPLLKEATEKRGLEWIEKASDEEFDKKITSGGFLNSLSEAQQEKAYKRVDSQILQAIAAFDGVPNSNNLGKHGGVDYSNNFIQRRFDSNSSLKDAAEQKGLKWIENASDEEFDKKNSSGFLNGSSKTQKQKAYDRVDSQILQAINAFDGVPNANNLSKGKGSLNYSHPFIQSRFDSNPLLKEATEKRGLEWIEKASDEAIYEKMTFSGFLNGLSETQKQKAYDRVDQTILQAINAFDGVPNANNLSKGKGSLNYSHSIIQRRIEKNPTLWLAICHKQGLSTDQAVELALERSAEQPPAVTQILKERLVQLYAFREMLGVVRVFSDLFNNATRVLEVSLYPEPLAKAIEMEGLSLEKSFVPLQVFRADVNARLENHRPDLVVLQGIHRLNQEAFNQLLAEVHKMLPPSTNVLATYSAGYASVEGFEAALFAKGFETVECGLLEIQPPEDDILAALVPQTDIRRLRAKLRGKSNVLYMVTTEGIATIVPELIKIEKDEGKPKVGTEHGEFEVPGTAVKEINAFFTPSLTTYPKEPLLISVVESGKKLAVIGYDMDPAKPKKVEVGIYPAGVGMYMDFRFAARKIAANAAVRERLGNDTKVELRKLREAISG